MTCDVFHRSSFHGFLFPPNCCLFFSPSLSLSLSLFFLYSCVGLTKDGSNENIDSLEEVLNILAEESSDWFYGFLSFLYDVLTPFEILEEEESEAADDVDGTSQNEGVQGKKTCVILDLQNQWLRLIWLAFENVHETISLNIRGVYGVEGKLPNGCYKDWTKVSHAM